jgi:genome maintenance exonuclease 1
MIIEKFPYKEIQRKRVDGKRLYDTESGFLPSVTTILDKTKPAESVEKLNEWRRRVGHEEAQRVTTEAANVGTLMHGYLEQWLKTGNFTHGSNMIHRVASSMANKVIENIEPHLDEAWGTEVGLYYPGLYAGTTDLVGAWKQKPTIMDFKQTNKPKKREWIDDYFMQGSAYGEAHNALFDTDIEQVAIFMCSRDCEFQLFELDRDEFLEYSRKFAIRVGEFYELDK